MTAAPRHPRQAKERSGRQSRTDPTPPRKAGRPQGPPSTIVNLRIPLDLLAQLDRYIDGLEVQSGLKANRGMIARRALELWWCSKSGGGHLHGPSKSIAVNEQANDDVVHLRGFREADGLTNQALNARP